MDCSTPVLTVHCQLSQLIQTHVHQGSDTSSYLILCHLLLPSNFLKTRFLSNELFFHIKWPKYWSFSFSISPSNEYSGLIYFRMDWLDLHAVQGTLKSSPTSQFKSTLNKNESTPIPKERISFEIWDILRLIGMFVTRWGHA